MQAPGVIGPPVTAASAGQNAAGAGGVTAAGQGAAGTAVSNRMQAGSGTAGSANAAGTGGMNEQASAGSSAGTGGSSEPAAMAGAGGSEPAAMAGAGGSAPVTCPATVMPPGDTTTTLQVGGMARTYMLHIPSSYTGKTPVPLVLDWHGLGSSGAAQQRISGYKALSDQEGFIAAWPNGLDNAWNIGPCCTHSRSVDDLGFARAVVADIQRRACVDPKRVYADGYSMGGGMSYYLACNAADLFAAVAPSAFDLLAAEEQPCMPSRPISVISFRGTTDPIVPHAGGASRPPNGLNVTIHFQGAESTFEKWSQLNECTGAPVDGASGCRTYTQCKEGTEVTLCTKQGGGHDPGDAEQGWAFMEKHAMP